jgi:hypothetical protein
MKKKLAILLAAAVAFSVTPAVAAEAKVKTFSSCTAVHKVYDGGIAKKGAKGNRNQYSKKMMPFEHTPKFSTALYKANKHLDRDKDGVVCEG